MYSISLIGNPNAGKTTLFNAFTGSKRTVGNYPGVTVEKYERRMTYKDQEILIHDLPGTYSLYAHGVEEQIVSKAILEDSSNAFVAIADGTTLEKSLFLALEILETQIPTVIAVNMMDEVEKAGTHINFEKLGQILKSPIIPIMAKSQKGILDILEVITEPKNFSKNVPFNYSSEIEDTLAKMVELLEASSFFKNASYSKRFLAIKILESHEDYITFVKEKDPDLEKKLSEMRKDLDTRLLISTKKNTERNIVNERHDYVKVLVDQTVEKNLKQLENSKSLTKNIDKFVTNRFLGPIILLLVLYLTYQVTFYVSGIISGYLEIGIGYLAEFALGIIPEGHLQSLIVDGIIGGVGGILGFTPIIFVMFMILTALNDSGYMPRVAHILDRIFHAFGLHGFSVMPYIISGGIAGGCAIPGVMATRCLQDRSQRLATMLTLPFMACGAKLPVFLLITAVIFPNSAANVMFILTLLGWVFALLVSLILRKTVFKGEALPFVMELPPYRLPSIKWIFVSAWDKFILYLKKAGTVILAVSMIIWVGMTYPQLPEEKALVAEEQLMATPEFQLLPEEEQTGVMANYINETALRYSFAGKIGVALEPIFAPAGFDWRINIAMVAGFAAKEVFVATLATSYSIAEEGEEPVLLSEAIAEDPDWTVARGWSVLLFTLLYSPCFVAVAVIKQESGAWKYAILSVLMTTAIAYVVSVATFQLLS